VRLRGEEVVGIEDKKRKRERERGVLNLGAYVGRAATARLAELFFRSSSLFSSLLFFSLLLSSLQPLVPPQPDCSNIHHL